MQGKRFGGSFAPPITAAKISEYNALLSTPAADEFDLKVKSTCKDLLKMVQVFQETPASASAGSKHPSGRGTIVPLEESEINRIDAYVPWDHECDAYQALFDKLPTGALRNAAFHLLWFAKELTKDREPLTNDKL